MEKWKRTVEMKLYYPSSHGDQKHVQKSPYGRRKITVENRALHSVATFSLGVATSCLPELSAIVVVMVGMCMCICVCYNHNNSTMIWSHVWPLQPLVSCLSLKPSSIIHICCRSYLFMFMCI